MPPRPMEAGETCCVCCDEMKEAEDLSHCRFGCGRYTHTECLERCFKHNAAGGKQMQCPLCRTNWGDKGLDLLKENTKAWRERKAQKAAETKPKLAQPPVSTEGLPQNDRGFKCNCCKRQLIYEAKYQCLTCIEIAICKLCFGVKYHPQHDFLVRPSPDRDWEPAFRDN